MHTHILPPAHTRTSAPPHTHTHPLSHPPKALADAFKTTYASEVPQHNGGLAVRLVDEAVGRFATRMGKALVGKSAARGGNSGVQEGTAELTLHDFNLEDPLNMLTRASATSGAAEEGGDAADAALTAQREKEREEREHAQAERVRLQKQALAELEGMIG